MLSTQGYDVDAPEGSTGGGSAYFSKKDLKWLLLILPIFFAIATPLWFGYKDQRDKQVCAANMRAVWGAMMEYSELWDSRLPPLYAVGENESPMLSDGKPFVWASLLDPYMNERHSFVCPSAHEDEAMSALSTKDSQGSLLMTYGMFAPMSAFPHPLLRDPGNTALILETSNHGSQGSYNPLPYRDSSGAAVPFDGFCVAFDDSNSALTRDSAFITRLAFRESAKGYGPSSKPRHGRGIHIIYADSHRGFMKSDMAEIRNLFPEAGPPWRTQ
jgi:hypothetical protein